MAVELLFTCPLAGEVVPVAQCADPTFAQGLLGPGVVILPRGNLVAAPVDGTVEFVLSTRHALGLRSPTGVKCLIHVGLDTNRLQGEGFVIHAAAGDQVRQGDPLLSFDLEVMRARGCSLDTPFVFCNWKPGWEMDLLRTGPAALGDDLLRVRLPGT